MRNSRLPKTVANWAIKNVEKLDDVRVEYDEWEPESPYSIWIDLKAGWVNTWTETHSIHEPTAKEALDQAKNYIEPCECQECLESIARKGL